VHIDEHAEAHVPQPPGFEVAELIQPELQLSAQSEQPLDLAEFSQLVEQALEHPELHADEPQPFFEDPIHDSLQDEPHPALAEPMQLSPQPSGSSLLHETKIIGLTTATPNIGISFLRKLRLFVSIIIIMIYQNNSVRTKQREQY